jgi:uncharacterized protein YjbI with pentapeptide repeats
MQNCIIENCKENAIFSENYCWNHLSDSEKKDYPRKLLSEIATRRTIKGESLRGVEITDTIFPDYVGFRNCDFSNAYIFQSTFQRVDFRGSNFNNACLKGCHFEYADFRGISTRMTHADARESHFENSLLQNTDFSNSDLRDCLFINSDMIGAKLEGAKLYAARIFETRLCKESFCNFNPTKSKRIRIGDELYNTPKNKEGPCREEGPDDEEGPRPLWARNVYNMLKNNFRSIGNYRDESWARSKERKMELKRLARLAFLGDRYADSYALERWEKQDQDKIFESRLSAFNSLCFKSFIALIGYGESPLKFFFLSVATIIVFTFVFLFMGFEYSVGKGPVEIKSSLEALISDPPKALLDLETALYMSVVTFTTLGYGDAHPLGASRIAASIEALMGFFIYSSFVATSIKRISEE